MRRLTKNAISVMCTACVVCGAALCIGMAERKRPDIILEDYTSSLITAYTTTEDKPVVYKGGEYKSLININTASESELKHIKGVGDKLAQQIIQYRKKNNGFKRIEDIKKVSGIGEKMFQKIKDSICVE